jgi:hypothetical protein
LIMDNSDRLRQQFIRIINYPFPPVPQWFYSPVKTDVHKILINPVNPVNFLTRTRAISPLITDCVKIFPQNNFRALLIDASM